MSAAKVRRMSPSSVAQDWVDRFGRVKGLETTFPFPSELPDHLPLPIYTSFNEKTIPLPARDVRNSPVSTASNLSQSSEQNSSSKCRQLPCRTFVSTGSCPYGDRCVFLHDPLIVSKPVFIKIKVCPRSLDRLLQRALTILRCLAKEQRRCCYRCILLANHASKPSHGQSGQPSS